MYLCLNKVKNDGENRDNYTVCSSYTRVQNSGLHMFPPNKTEISFTYKKIVKYMKDVPSSAISGY